MVKKNQNFKSYNFNSVGEKTENFQILQGNTGLSNPLPIGIKTPMRISDSSGELFQMNTKVMDQIKDNFKNLLLTNHGERLGMHDFGANLRELTFELGNESFDEQAILRIKSAVKKYMPYLDLQTFVPFNTKNTELGIAEVGFTITYGVPLLEENPQKIKVTLYSGG